MITISIDNADVPVEISVHDITPDQEKDLFAVFGLILDPLIRKNPLDRPFSCGALKFHGFTIKFFT